MLRCNEREDNLLAESPPRWRSVDTTQKRGTSECHRNRKRALACTTTPLSPCQNISLKILYFRILILFPFKIFYCFISRDVIELENEENAAKRELICDRTAMFAVIVLCLIGAFFVAMLFLVQSDPAPQRAVSSSASGSRPGSGATPSSAPAEKSEELEVSYAERKNLLMTRAKA